MPLLLKKDSLTAAKRPNCTTGEPCGGTCIDPKEVCNIELSPEMRARVETLRTGLLNTIPGYAQVSTARAVINDFKRVRESGDRGQQAMYLGAVLLGTSVLGYATFRDKYRDEFINSAEVAIRRAKGMASSVPDIGDKQNVIFAVDSSLSKGDKGRGGGLAAELMADEAFAAKYHVATIKQNAHYSPKDMDSLNGRDRRIAEAMVPIKQALMNARNGQNDAAVELASQILAYQNKYGTKTVTWTETVGGYGNQKSVQKTKEVETDFQMNILGHGDGGMVASEAMEILKLTPKGRDLTNKINVIGLNTPDAGLTDTVGQVKTIASRNSPLSWLPMKNKITMDAPDGDGGRTMLRKKAVREFIDGHFGGAATDIVKPKPDVPKSDVPKAAATQSTSGQQTLNLQTTGGQPMTAAERQAQAAKEEREADARERIARRESTQEAIKKVPQLTLKATSPSASGEVDDLRKTIQSNIRISKFSTELLKKKTRTNPDTGEIENVGFEEKFNLLRKQFPDVSNVEAELAKSVYKAPPIVKDLLESGELSVQMAGRFASLVKSPEDRTDLETFLGEEMAYGFDLDFTNPDSVNRLIADFHGYKRNKPKFQVDSWKTRIALLNKRLDALKLRVG